MALTSRGNDIAVTTNPVNGKLRRIWDTTGSNKGNPRFDNTAEHAVWLCVFCKRGQYWADTTGNFGSYVMTLLSDPKATPQKFVSYALDGLAPLVTAGRIRNPQAFATRTFDRLNGTVQYSTPDGKPQTVRPSLPIT